MVQNLGLYNLINSKISGQRQYKQVRIGALFATIFWVVCMGATYVHLFGSYTLIAMYIMCVVYLIVLYFLDNTRKKLIKEALAADDTHNFNINKALKEFENLELASSWSKNSIVEDENKLAQFNRHKATVYATCLIAISVLTFLWTSFVIKIARQNNVNLNLAHHWTFNDFFVLSCILVVPLFGITMFSAVFTITRFPLKPLKN